MGGSSALTLSRVAVRQRCEPLRRRLATGDNEGNNDSSNSSNSSSSSVGAVHTPHDSGLGRASGAMEDAILAELLAEPDTDAAALTAAYAAPPPSSLPPFSSALPSHAEADARGEFLWAAG